MTEDQYRALATQLTNDLPVVVEKLETAQAELAEDRSERRGFEKLVRLAIRVGAVLVAGVAALGVVAVLMLTNIIEGRAQSRANIAKTTDQTAAIQEQTRQLTALVQKWADCTTPGGECYGQNEGRTGAAVAEIIRLGAQRTEAIARCRYSVDAAAFDACLAALPPLMATP